MKRYSTIAGLVAVLMGALVSCQEPLLNDEMGISGKEGYVKVSFKADVPGMGEILTKAVDPDGEDITTIDLYCFNARGLFISIERAIIDRTGSHTGIYSAEIPEVTDRIHFIANMHKDVDEMDFVGQSEDQVIATMEGSSGMMTYWARVVKGGNDTMKSALEGNNPVMLLRDHARITVQDSEDNPYYQDLAFIVLNTNAFGTVAPYRDGDWAAPSNSDKFVTLPESDRKDVKVSGQTEVIELKNRQYQYVFETENSSSDPVSVIIRGRRNGETKYFRVLLIDDEANYVPVMRNFTYKIQILGEMTYGVSSFEEALVAPATNNVWLSVADDVKEVRSSDYSLAVEETHIVLGVDDPIFSTTHRQLAVSYSLEKLDGTGLSAGDEPEIKWLEGNDVAHQVFASRDFSVNGNIAQGKVEVILNTLQSGEVKREGTLLIKKGMLERKVKIVTVAKQNFIPSWITTNIYGGATGSKVTMMFTVPEEFPAELFPMDVLVSVNDLDVRNESGMSLPVIRKDDERYGRDVYAGHAQGNVYQGEADAQPIGYKYVLKVESPGIQRLYLETILGHKTDDYVEVTIEADHFETLTKTATFKADTDKRILIHNLRSYAASTPADEYIYYYLVPQKIHALVEFETHLGEVTDTPMAEGDGVTLEDPQGNKTHFKFIAPNMDFDAAGGYNVDEFFLYSQNLEHNHDVAEGKYYFNFYKNLDPSKWSSTAGRVLGFYRNTNASDATYGATLHLRTTTPKADEVVRIASNAFGAESVTTGEGGDKVAVDAYKSAECTGTGSYRSVVFELATFPPFHFSAQVETAGKKIGSAVYGAVQDPTDNISLSYEPGQGVNIEFDVTSFKSNMQNAVDAEQLSVDPFGTAFDIYIDAPTLELDMDKVEAWGLSSKIRKDPSVPGRVIYTVEAERDAERWSSPAPVKSAIAVDGARLDLFRKPIGAVDQSGERKTIPFKTGRIVSAGDITISSDESKVIYYAKKFNIQNYPVKGTMTYGPSSTPVPAGAFVPFSVNDGTRIGVVTVDNAGQFHLILRAEYSYDWKNTPVNFEYDNGAGEYKATFASLEELFSDPAVNML